MRPDEAKPEAWATLRSLVRQQMGESHQRYLEQPVARAGLQARDGAALERTERKRAQPVPEARRVNLHDRKAQITGLRDAPGAARSPETITRIVAAADQQVALPVAVVAEGGRATADAEGVSEEIANSDMPAANSLGSSRQWETAIWPIQSGGG